MARVRLLLFARAREAAGASSDTFEASDLASLLTAARRRYGADFAAVLDSARVWHNGDEPASAGATILADDDEVAVLPPVSGG